MNSPISALFRVQLYFHRAWDWLRIWSTEIAIVVLLVVGIVLLSSCSPSAQSMRLSENGAQVKCNRMDMGFMCWSTDR